jgi:hypothetical protein
MNTSQIAGTAAQFGWRAVARQFGNPLTGLVEMIKTGQVTDALGRDIQNMGLGVERVAHPVLPSMHVDEDGFSQLTNKAEYLAAKGARYSLTASGHILSIDAARLYAARLAEQQWLDAGLSGRGMVKDLGEQRVLALGLDPADPVIARIEQYIADSAVTRKGWAGYKLVDPMTSEWKNPDGTLDVEAVAAYRNAISLAATRSVVVPDSTDLPLWMSSPSASLLVQFRKFALTNLRNRFMFNMNMGDRAAVSSMMLEIAGAGVGYALATYLRSLGREDAQDYRDRMLAPDMIAKAAVARASWMNIAPLVVDTTMQDVLRRQAVFEHSRTTGLRGGFWSGNPTVDHVSSLMGSLGSVQSLFADDYAFSRQDLENIRKGWWIPNVYGVQQLFQKIGDNLPEHSVSK